MLDVLVIGGGPAGVVAAMRAGDLGASTALVTEGEFGGMAANDGPVPVRTLAHAARLIRDARQLGRYGVQVGEPRLDYSQLLERVRKVVDNVRSNSTFRSQTDSAGVQIHENAGVARFLDPHTVVTASGLTLKSDKIVLCTGGSSRKLSVPGAELTATHSDAWGLTTVPQSIIVIGGGATGAQVASVFNAFGAKIHLFQSGPRILPTEDEDVSAAVATAFRESGIAVREDFGSIESFEKTPAGIRMNFSRNGDRESAEATLAVVAIGWVANTSELELSKAGVEINARGFISIDEFLRTSVGRFELANEATIFLDGIGELPLELQSKLLRVIQEGEFERLGSSKTIKVDVRIVAATNRNLKIAVEQGSFREDLYYRLNVFPITVPPLRDRREDIPVLVEHFVKRFSQKVGRRISAIPPASMRILQEHTWPGNVRELANVIERAVINTDGTVLRIVDHFEKPSVEERELSDKTLAELEKEYIIRILGDTGWRIDGHKGAARILGLNPSTLRARMAKLGIRKLDAKTMTSVV